MDVPQAYNATIAQFESKYTKELAYVPFSFGTTTALLQKADMTVVANAFDCGECHVGGAGMQYLVNAPGNTPVSLRDIATSADVPGGALGYPGDPGHKVTASNYFVDQYDVDDNGVKFEAKFTDWSNTGVVEMDCFMCHLQGYQYKDRKDAIRMVKFDATIPIGAGLATSETVWPMNDLQAPVGYGTAVVYDASKLVPVNGTNGTNGYKLAPAVASNLKGKPPTANCSTCHFDMHAVDWKKRGDSLEGDVHANLGCMACHERKDGKDANGQFKNVGTSGDFEPDYPVASNRATAVPVSADRAKLGLCDPAKGGASPYDGLANQLDSVNFKNCVGCHSPGPKTYQTFGAKNPDSAHKAKGVSLPMVQKANGTIGSHMDIISCEACHVKKNQYVTGGHIVDGTGVDLEGRVADHEHNAYAPTLAKPAPDQHYLTNAVPMTNRTAYAWSLDGKLHPVNLHTSFFIRSKNDLWLDINQDTRIPGVDSLLQTHAAEATNWTPSQALFSDGKTDAAEIDAYFLKVFNKLEAMTGLTHDLQKPTAQPLTLESTNLKLSFMTVPFKNSHNIARGFEAFGAGGCKDCHSAHTVDGNGKTTAGGFYNGIYDLKGGYDIKWNKAQTAPMTKVNGDTETSTTHPTVTDKWRDVSLAVDSRGTAGLTNPDRSEFMYPATFREYNTAWSSEIVGGPPLWATGLASSQGWLMKLEICADTNINATTGVCAPANIIHRTKQVSANVTTISALLTNLNKVGATGTMDFTGGFEFNIAGSGNVSESLVCVPATGVNCTGLKITAKTDPTIYKLRLAKLASGPEFGLPGQFIPKTVKKVNAVETDPAYAGRDQWVAYLNTLGETSTAYTTATATPVAAIASIAGSTNPVNVAFPVQVVIGANVPLVVKNPQAGMTYTWTFSDGVNRGAATEILPSTVPKTYTYAGVTGANTSTTFTKTGVWTVTLTAKNAAGVISKAYGKVSVNPAPSAIAVSDKGESFEYIPTVGATVAELAAEAKEAAATTTVGINLGAISASYDRLYIIWGDGAKQWVNPVTGSLDVTHKFNRYAMYKQLDGTYKYNMTVYLYNGTTKVGQQANYTITVGAPL